MSVMILRAMCGTESIHLRELKKTAKETRKGKTVESIASIDYIDQILKLCLKLWYKAVEEEKRQRIYIQDGASIYSSAKVCLWLCSYRIEVMERPPTNPDLNLTENMGKGSKGKIRRYSRLITNEKDMFEADSRE